MNETLFIAWIGRIRKALRREFEVRAAPLDITAAQFQVLKRLWMGDGIPTSQLTLDAGSDGGTVTGILDRLESRKLIRRERSTEDRRAVKIWLTEEGRSLQAPLMAIVNSINEQALDGLKAEERALLVKSLEKVSANLNA